MTLDEKIELVRRSFRDVYIQQIEAIKDLHGDFYITSGMMVCIGLDTLTGYYNGRDSTPKLFIDFVEAYMDRRFRETIPGWRNEGEARDFRFSEILYRNYRCGLVHSLSFKRRACFTPGINPETGLEFQYIWGDMWVETNQITMFINLPKFIEDFRRVVDKYFEHLKQAENKNIRDNFEKRFDELWIR